MAIGTTGCGFGERRRLGRRSLRLKWRVREAYEAFRIIAAFVAFSGLLGLTQNSAFSLGERGDSPWRVGRPTPQNVQRVDRIPAVLRETPQLWLVDGFNVLNVALLRGAERDDFWGPVARERLIDLVREFPEAGNVVLVFDGARPLENEEAGTGTRARLVFAPDADKWVLRAIRERDDPSRVAVVTADRRLAARARRRGARIVSPGQFVAECRRATPATERTRGEAFAKNGTEDATG